MPPEGARAIDNIFDVLQLDKVAYLILAIVILTIVVRLFQRLSESLQKSMPMYRLLVSQVSTIASFLFYIVGVGTLTYAILKPPRELLLAIGGSTAVAVGFALKDLVGSFLGGLVLLFDKPFQVGDRVTFDGVYGEVISIGLRSVCVKTLDDSLLTIPNIEFFTKSVQSANAGSLDMMVTCCFYVALEEDITKSKELLYEIVTTSRFAFLKKPVNIIAEEVEIAQRLAVCLKVKAYVLDVKYEKDFQTDIVTRATKLFNKTGIIRPKR
jgi:small-conductance mechanosensitive channel